MNNYFFLLYADCILTEGFTRSAIYDLRTSTYIYIPKVLSEIILKLQNISIADLKNEFNSTEDIEGIDKFISFLISKNMGFLTDTPSSFPPIEKTYNSPHIITNSIIDFDADSDYFSENIFIDLNKLGCNSIQIRFFKGTKLDVIVNVISLIKKYTFSFVSIVIDCDVFNLDIVQSIINSKKDQIIVYSCTENMTSIHKNLIFFKHEIIDENDCGYIDRNLTINVFHYLESISFNSCLNRKISISKKGIIKNCPAINESYGFIKTTSLLNVAIDPKFQKLWNLKKDNFTDCSVCEHRYFCTDCRAFMDLNEISTSKPKKCLYNPYLGKWEK